MAELILLPQAYKIALFSKSNFRLERSSAVARSLETTRNCDLPIMSVAQICGLGKFPQNALMDPQIYAFRPPDVTKYLPEWAMRKDVKCREEYGFSLLIF